MNFMKNEFFMFCWISFIDVCIKIGVTFGLLQNECIKKTKKNMNTILNICENEKNI